MSRGISLHVGLNVVDPNAYGGWDGRLAACILDAQDMEAHCRAQGFEPRSLHDAQATVDALTAAVREAAAELGEGDIFALTYSGHGGQIPDAHEEDGYSETWCLSDRQFVDDEVYALLTGFAAGVRVVVVSDSCHSGSVIRGFVPDISEHKAMPVAARDADLEQRGDMYAEIQRDLPAIAEQRGDMRATALLLSGCQDNQVSLDGARNGAFTAKLRSALAEIDTGVSLDYRGLHRRIAEQMPPSQSPNYMTVGPLHATFEAQTPFTI